MCQSHHIRLSVVYMIGLFWLSYTYSRALWGHLTCLIWQSHVYSPKQQLALEMHTWPASHVIWLIYMWHASCIYDMTRWSVTQIIHIRNDLHMWHASFIHDMTHSYVICLIHVWCDPFLCDMTRACETWLICLWHELIHVTWLIHIYIATLLTTPTHAHVNTHPQKNGTEPQHIHSLLFQLTHLHASLHSSFFFGADMGGSVLKEMCTGPSYPNSAALCVAWRWGAFKCVAVCCSVV